MFFLKKVWGVFGIKVIVFLLIFFGGYYLFLLAPRLALSNAYLKAEELFAERKMNLTQNRVALVELARLSPRSGNLFGEESALLQKLQETNAKGLESLKGTQKLPYVVGIPSKSIDFLNRELPAALPPLLEKERVILEEQGSLIAVAADFSAITAPLLQYDFAQDIGSFNLSSQKEETIAAAKAARVGLGNIVEKLTSFEQKSKELDLLKKEIQKTQNTLDAFVFELKRGNTQGTAGLRKNLARQFAILKEETLAVQFGLIRSDASISLLTRQTNLILEYEFWVKKIATHQARLPAPGVSL